MHRMGHGSMRAALTYQHATTDPDRLIADALGDLVNSTRTAPTALGQAHRAGSNEETPGQRMERATGIEPA
jgi:hypothetical protein